MKTLVISLLLLFLGGGYDGVSAAITERIIYAGNTPLASDCRVTQTGPMELTVMPCSWTTTGDWFYDTENNSSWRVNVTGIISGALIPVQEFFVTSGEDYVV
ncbi:hypothetical protein LCGC14_2014320, partial [marine sediment metagenome]